MQLKNRFIANAGTTNVLVIISAKAANMPMILSAVCIRCMVIKSYIDEGTYR